MGKPTGFMETGRELPHKRPVVERVKDWKEYQIPLAPDHLKNQAARCMDCGIPFCHMGCPLGNIVPDWNDLFTATAGRKPLSACTPRTIFRNLPAVFAPLPVKIHAR